MKNFSYDAVYSKTVVCKFFILTDKTFLQRDCFNSIKALMLFSIARKKCDNDWLIKNDEGLREAPFVIFCCSYCRLPSHPKFR